MAIQRKIAFSKMQGAGNDFIVIDSCRRMDYAALAKKACDRTFGVGADGLLILDQSRKADFRMHIYNADGSLAAMCGNGLRCLAAYIVRNKKTRRQPFTVETLAGTMIARAAGEHAQVELNPPTDYRPNIALNVAGRKMQVHFINTGVPHTIVYVEGLDNIDVNRIGEIIRYHKHFMPAGTNVNFVEQIGPQKIAIRTYERGVENETMACGTGSVAAAIVSFFSSCPEVRTGRNLKTKVLTQSGEWLEVLFDMADGQVQRVGLNGGAKLIAEGIYFL